MVTESVQWSTLGHYSSLDVHVQQEVDKVHTCMGMLKVNEREKTAHGAAVNDM